MLTLIHKLAYVEKMMISAVRHNKFIDYVSFDGFIDITDAKFNKIHYEVYNNINICNTIANFSQTHEDVNDINTYTILKNKYVSITNNLKNFQVETSSPIIQIVCNDEYENFSDTNFHKYFFRDTSMFSDDTFQLFMIAILFGINISSLIDVDIDMNATLLNSPEDVWNILLYFMTTTAARISLREATTDDISTPPTKFVFNTDDVDLLTYLNESIFPIGPFTSIFYNNMESSHGRNKIFIYAGNYDANDITPVINYMRICEERGLNKNEEISTIFRKMLNYLDGDDAIEESLVRILNDYYKYHTVQKESYFGLLIKFRDIKDVKQFPISEHIKVIKSERNGLIYAYFSLLLACFVKCGKLFIK